YSPPPRLPAQSSRLGTAAGQPLVARRHRFWYRRRQHRNDESHPAAARGEARRTSHRRRYSLSSSPIARAQEPPRLPASETAKPNTTALIQLPVNFRLSTLAARVRGVRYLRLRTLAEVRCRE